MHEEEEEMKRSEYNRYTHFNDEDADRIIVRLEPSPKKRYEGELPKNARPFNKLKGIPNLKSVFSDKLDPSVHDHRLKRHLMKDRSLRKDYENRRREQIRIIDEVKMNMIRKKEVAMEARDLQDLARQFSRKAMETLVQILDNPDSSDNAKIAAIGMLWDRGFGKAAQTQVNINANADAKPSELDVTSLDRRIADAIHRVEKLTDRTSEEGTSEKRPSDLRKYN